MDGIVTNIKDLKDWFDQVNFPGWKLYRGDIKHRDLIIESPKNDLGMEASWDMLEKMLNMHGRSGGKFTVFVPEKGRGHGPKCFFSFYPDRHSPNYQQAGIGGFPVSNGESVQEAIAKERHLWELEKKVEDLEAASNHKENFWDRLLDRITEDPATTQKLMDVAGTAVDRISGMVIGTNPAQVGVAGFEQPAAPPPATGPVNDDEFLYDQNRVLESLDRIREAVPEMEIHDLLESMAEYLENNPSMRGMLISQLKKQKANG